MPIRFSLRKYLNPVFIETGTFHGEGVTKALRAGFKKIHSIELNPDYYSELSRRFERQIRQGRVRLYCGDSLKVLPVILAQLNCRATFWLDAHYCGGDTACGSLTSPLLGELEVIARHAVHTHTILIDDLRLFGTDANEDWRLVTRDKVIEKLRAINSGYRFKHEPGEVRDDVLAAEASGSPLLKLIGSFEELLTPWLSATVRLFRKMAERKE